jgi:hypothetical protein
MESFSAVIDAFGGPSSFGRAIGIPDSHARTMKTRDSIPAARWPRVEAEAKARRIRGVTVEQMAELAAKRAEAAS